MRTTIIIRNIPNKMSRKAILNTFLTCDNVWGAVELLRRNKDAALTEEFLESHCQQGLFQQSICGSWNKVPYTAKTYNVDNISTLNINDLAGSKLHMYVRELIDWFHIPLQSKRAVNKGYAFINFRDHRYIPIYVYALTGLKFPGYQTNKMITVEFSSKQIRTSREGGSHGGFDPAGGMNGVNRPFDAEGPIFMDQFAPEDLEYILIPPNR